MGAHYFSTFAIRSQVEVHFLNSDIGLLER